MNRVRVLFCLVAATFGLSSVPAVAGHYYNVPNAPQLLEHLVRHSDELLTEVNLTRANQFLIINPVLVDIRAQGGWGAGFYSRLLVGQNNQIPEYFIGKIVNDFRMQTILLYDLWWRYRGPNPAFSQQFILTDQAYSNALASVYFYIEGLRRSYIIRGAQGKCWSQQVLLRRLMKLERLAWELRELMMSVRYANAFQFPVRRVCLESTYRPFRVNVQVNVAQNFVPFPFYYENRFYSPDYVQPVAPGSIQGGPAYDVGYWNERWKYIDNSYIQGYQPNLPANYDQRPYTPVNQGPGYPQQDPGYGQGGPAPIQPQPQVQPQPQPGQQGQAPGYPDLQDPLSQPQQQPVPGSQPGYPVGGNGDVVPSNDYSY
jgi:hypothetical protein